jgi:hypothetical protein
MSDPYLTDPHRKGCRCVGCGGSRRLRRRQVDPEFDRFEALMKRTDKWGDLIKGARKRLRPKPRGLR